MASHLALRVLAAQELSSDEVLVPAFHLINECYNDDGGSDGELDRYSSPEQFLQDVGADGLCAIIQDLEKDATPVAVVIAMRWRRRHYQPQAPFTDDAQDWEIGPAASRNLPQYRGKGLIERCLQGLSARLLLSQVGGGPVRLWVKVIEESYATYWARRGFEQRGSSYVVPVGEWHRDRSYTLVDMMKEISRETESAGNAISRQ